MFIELTKTETGLKTTINSNSIVTVDEQQDGSCHILLTPSYGFKEADEWKFAHEKVAVDETYLQVKELLSQEIQLLQIN